MNEQDKLQYIYYMQMREELENVAYGGIELKLDGSDSNAHSGKKLSSNQDLIFWAELSKSLPSLTA